MTSNIIRFPGTSMGPKATTEKLYLTTFLYTSRDLIGFIQEAETKSEVLEMLKKFLLVLVFHDRLSTDEWAVLMKYIPEDAPNPEGESE